MERRYIPETFSYQYNKSISNGNNLSIPLLADKFTNQENKSRKNYFFQKYK